MEENIELKNIRIEEISPNGEECFHCEEKKATRQIKIEIVNDLSTDTEPEKSYYCDNCMKKIQEIQEKGIDFDKAFNENKDSIFSTL